MTKELFYLSLTAVLTGALWIPVVVGRVMARGFLKPADYKVPPSSPLPAWVDRANRAHVNAVETFGPFAAVVVVAHVLGVSTAITVDATTAYFFIRLAHALVHVSGSAFLRARTLLFSAGWCAFMAIAVEVLRHG